MYYGWQTRYLIVLYCGKASQLSHMPDSLMNVCLSIQTLQASTAVKWRPWNLL